MGLFSRLPDYSEMSVEERLGLEPWRQAFEGILESNDDAILVINADGGQALSPGNLIDIPVGVFALTYTNVCYAYVYRGKRIERLTRGLSRVCALKNTSGMFQINFDLHDHDFWWVNGDHDQLLGAFHQVWSETNLT